uniref:Protein real-time n=1 Tax=Globodera pallida TaxID=36090 RepID=A0A183CJ23_GLOPA
MVQTYQSPVRVYKHPFELVMAAYHKRFPTCPQIPIFVGSEITDEWRSDDGAEEIIERKCQLNVDAPYLVKKIASVDFIYFKQRNHLNMRQRTLLIEASNISFSSRIVVVENCKYYVHTENSEWTCFEQSASLDVKSFFGFETAVEKLAVKQYGSNIAKGKEVLEYFIDELIKSGTTHIPLWSAAEDGSSTKVDDLHHALATDSAIDVSSTDGAESSGGAKSATASDHGATKESAFEGRPPTSLPSPTTAAASCSTGTAPDILSAEYVANAPPLSGTAEEKLSVEKNLQELKRTTLDAASDAPPGTKASVKLAMDRTRSFDDQESKLESEYIQRFLGQLTPLEVLNSLLWRKQHKIDSLLNDFAPPAVFLKYFPGGWHHNDNQGRPLFILRLGQMDIKGLLRSVGLESIVKFTLLICEQGLNKTAEATHRLGKPISTWTLLVDLEGLSMRHLWRPGVQCLLRIIEIVEAHYPETMGLVLITRAPRVFPVLWTLVLPFIDENTRKKFELYASEDVLKELGRDELKNCLTNTYTNVTVNKGIPYEIYVWIGHSGSVLTWDFDIVKGECEFIIYQSDKKISSGHHQQQKQSASSATNAAGIGAGGGAAAGSGLAPSSVASSVMGPVERVVDEISNLLSSSGTSSNTTPHFHTITGEPDFRVGVELSETQRPLSFGEGDSMQGSHYCAKPGTYILQWRHLADIRPAHAVNAHTDGQRHDSQASAALSAASAAVASSITTASTTVAVEVSSPEAVAASEKLQHRSGGGGGGSSTTTHKCRLMVYHEVLNSADFKGSVASLHSCRSSFNSLGAGDSLQSAAPSHPNSPNTKQRVVVPLQQQQKCQNMAGNNNDADEDTTTDQTPKAR